MPELRKDPITSRWVIISTVRGNRPNKPVVRPETAGAGFCPFCAGNEDKTPPEITAIRKSGDASNQSNWTIRVVPNKFPALQIEGDLDRRGEGLYDFMTGIGAHEVIIETPSHLTEFADLEVEHIKEVLLIYRSRMLDLKNDQRFKYILVFKNQGTAAGASLDHAHSQLIATPIIPKRVLEELVGAREHFERKERCIYCDILRQELHTGKRIVQAKNGFVALEPFAPRFPYETWLLPESHESHFEETPLANFEAMAVALKELLLRIQLALGNPHYNFVLHASPIQEQPMPDFHWHFEIIPKLTHVAGFEWGSGFYINPTPPEAAAKYLRETQV